MDDNLIQRAINGDQNALAGLLYNNYEFVFKFMVKLTYNKSLSEDLTQETMIRAIEKINLFVPGKSKFSSWLITLAKNIYVDHLRKYKHEQNLFSLDDLLPQFEIHTGEDSDSVRNMLEALRRLSDDIRIPIILKHYYGYSYDEIAAIMAKPPGTVKSRIHNGIGLLRKELEASEMG
jgi:RNA polymerase sigma-70 factor (ECF subfamily)